MEIDKEPAGNETTLVEQWDNELSQYRDLMDTHRQWADDVLPDNFDFAEAFRDVDEARPAETRSCAVDGRDNEHVSEDAARNADRRVAEEGMQRREWDDDRFYAEAERNANRRVAEQETQRPDSDYEMEDKEEADEDYEEGADADMEDA